MHDIYKADMDGDGHDDIITIHDGILWYKVTRDTACLPWQEHKVSGHSEIPQHGGIAAGVLDGDGDKDLFSAGVPLSVSVPNSYIWENLDGKGGDWKEHIVNTGKREHEAAGADMDGDGDIDILVKTWMEGEQYYLENQLIPNPGSGLRNGKGPETRKKASSSRNTADTRSARPSTRRFHRATQTFDAGGRSLLIAPPSLK